MNPHWGETSACIRQCPADSDGVPGLDRSQRSGLAAFLDSIDGAQQDFKMEFSPLKIVATSPEPSGPVNVEEVLGFISTDDRPGAPEGNVFGRAIKARRPSPACYQSAGFRLLSA